MGVIHGDKLASSDKLAQVSPTAAGHYSTFLSNSRITDDFGRVKLLYHRIWVVAFERRLEIAERTNTPDPITLDMVRSWFAEYIGVGLLRTWECNGSVWGEWVGWKAKSPSHQRYHRAPEPPGSNHEHSAHCKATGAQWDGFRTASPRKTRRSREASVGASTPSPPSPPSPSASTEEELTDLSAAPTVEVLRPEDLVFQHWRDVMEHRDAKFTSKRLRAVQGRLKDGYSVDRLKAAIDGCRASPWHMGANERQTVYDDLELICRDGSKVEQFEDRLKQKALPESDGVIEGSRRWWEKHGGGQSSEA